MNRADVIEEAEFMFAGGMDPGDVAAALGYSHPLTLSRVLYRAGRPDLGRKSAAGRQDRDRWHPKTEAHRG